METGIINKNNLLTNVQQKKILYLKQYILDKRAGGGVPLVYNITKEKSSSKPCFGFSVKRKQNSSASVIDIKTDIRQTGIRQTGIK